MPTPAERASFVVGKIPTDQELKDLVERQIRDAIRDDRKERGENDQLRAVASELLEVIKRLVTEGYTSGVQTAAYTVLRKAGQG